MSDHPFSLDLFDDPSSSEADNRQVAFTDLRAAQLLSLLKSKKLDPVLTATKVGATLVRYTLTLKRSLGKKALRDLEDELALLLICSHVWLYQGEKNTLYVETPRENPNFFSLRGLLEEPSFQKASSPLTFAVGRDFEGHPILADLAKLPHLLIAGRDGSGRSIALHTLLLSLLYKSTPEQLNLLLIDPSAVELPDYNGLSHAIVPVITRPNAALAALHYTERDLETRYGLLEKAGCRNIDDYNKKKTGDLPTLPRLVVVIDCLDHLMMCAQKEFTDSIARIAMKGRAAGIHLVLSTNRPDANVISYYLSANVPSRLVLSTVTSLQSRRALLSAGAEKLCERGDAYFLPPGALAPLRLQCPYVSDREVKRITDALKKSYGDANPYERFVSTAIREEVEQKNGKKPKKKAAPPPEREEPPVEPLYDPLYEQARHVVLTQGVCNVSGLQRTLQIGYGRAAKLVDMLTEQGVLSPPDGTNHKRKILIQPDQDETERLPDVDFPILTPLFQGFDKPVDPLLLRSVDVLLSYGCATTAVLQKELSIGYGRAVDLLEQLEQAGVLALYAQEGNHALLITKQEWERQKKLFY